MNSDIKTPMMLNGIGTWEFIKTLNTGLVICLLKKVVNIVYIGVIEINRKY